MRHLHLSVTTTVLLMALVFAVAGVVMPTRQAVAATVQTCERFGTVDVNGKTSVVQNNEWNSTLQQCISVDNVTGAFTLTTSNPNLPTNGAPSAYPSIFKGCHWGNCTNNSGMPVQVSAISTATSSWSTTQPASGIYDVAYDIWFNTTPTTTGQPNGAELMIWINFRGSIQPVGSRVASGVSIAGATWDVWIGNSGWNVISFVRTAGTTSVSNLNLQPFISDSVSRGQIQTSWFLIAIEAGFETWQGGAGLATNSFSATVSGGGGGNTPTRTPIGPTNTPTRTPTGPTNTPTRTPTPGGGQTCSPVTSTIAAPFTFDGAGTFCWQASNLGSFVNSWNLQRLTINGVDFTNRWAGSSSYPPSIGGFWYVSYTSNVAWGHFEAR